MAARAPREASSGAAVVVVPSDASDEELVDRARSGDAWARAALFARHLGALRTTVVRLLSDRADAEDAIHDTVVEALERLGGLRDGGAFRAWLLRIAVGKVHRRYRRRRLLAVLGLWRREPEAPLEAFASEDAPQEVRAELARLDAALTALGAAPRIAWMLRNVEGMKLEEVADACACSLATAKRRIAAAEECLAARVMLAAREQVT